MEEYLDDFHSDDNDDLGIDYNQNNLTQEEENSFLQETECLSFSNERNNFEDYSSEDLENEFSKENEDIQNKTENNEKLSEENTDTDNKKNVSFTGRYRCTCGCISFVDVGRNMCKCGHSYYNHKFWND